MDLDAVDDNDEVVHEMNVYLSKSQLKNLSLFSHPTKFNAAISEDQQVLSARVKPKQNRLEIEVGLNIHSENYDRSKGEQMAYNIDGQVPKEESYYDKDRMNKVMLLGTNATNPCQSYAVGVIRQGQLHVTPVKSVIEINPDLVHMDKIDVALKRAESLDEDESEEAVAVSVRFEGPNAMRDRRNREKSYQHFLKKISKEPWVDVNYHVQESGRSKREYEKLFCPYTYKDSRPEIAFDEYVKDLVPEGLRLSGYEAENLSLEDETLSQQIIRFFLNAQVLTFQMVLKKFPNAPDRNTLERELQLIGLLVQGCWVVKSNLVYEDNTVSPYSGTRYDILRTARDYVLWLFTKSRFVTRQQLSSEIRIPDEDFKSIISSLAVKRNNQWEFRLPFDKDYTENSPLVHSQELKWNLIYKKILNFIKKHESECKGSSSNPSQPSVPSSPREKRNARRSISESDGSGTETVGGSSRKRSGAFSPEPAAFNIGTLDVCPTYIETPLAEAVRGQLRDRAGDAVKQQFCMSLNDIKKVLRLGHLSSIVDRRDFEQVLEEALNEYGAQKLKNKWPQNTTPEVLFAFAKFGNKLDRYRFALLELFSTTARTRGNLLVKKIEDELRESISEYDCRQIFDEYCIYKSGFYYLKGTITPDP